MRGGALTALLLAGLLAGCADDPVAGAPDAGGADAQAFPETDAGPREHLQIPATNGTFDTDYRIGIQGNGTGLVGHYAIDHGTGTVVVAGVELPAVVYEQQPWPEFGYVLYQAMAVAPDRVFLMWFYCETDGISGIYIEGTDGTPLTLVSSSGICEQSGLSTTVEVSLPAIDLEVPRITDGYMVDGAELQLDGATPGHVMIGGSDLDVYVFEEVNCRTGCGADGWTELHAILWDPQQQLLCFGIFYLYESDRETVYLTYTFSLPVLADPYGSAVFDAAWTPPA